MILMPIELVSLGMSFFLNQPFFSTQQPLEFPSLAHNLQNSLLYLIYHIFLSRQHQYKGLNLVMFIVDTLLLHLILLQVSLRFLHIFLRHLILFYPFPMIQLLFVEALDLKNLPKGMAFQPLWLCLVLCLLFPFPLVTHGLWNMNVGKKQWKQNFNHLRKIILGTLFLVLQMLSPLVVSASIP